MLHVLLLILKILGILLLVIFGILLALIFVLLLAPVRYRGDVSFCKRPAGDVVASWLFRIFRARLSYDGSLKLQVKALWLVLFEETLWGEEDKEEGKDKDIFEDESLDGLLDRETSDREFQEREASNREFQEREASNREFQEREASDRTLLEQQLPDITEDAEEVEMVHMAELSGDGGIEEEPDAERQRSGPETVNDVSKGAAEAGKNRETEGAETRTASEAGKANAVRRILRKIRGICTGAGEAWEAARKKYRRVKSLVTDEENQATFRLLLRQAKALLKHVLPRKIKGNIRFGFDEPYYTGQVLTIISPFYGFYAKTLAVEPVFDEKVLEGELHWKGHIRLAAILLIGLRIFLNKNFRRLLKEFRK